MLVCLPDGDDSYLPRQGHADLWCEVAIEPCQYTPRHEACMTWLATPHEPRRAVGFAGGLLTSLPSHTRHNDCLLSKYSARVCAKGTQRTPVGGAGLWRNRDPATKLGPVDNSSCMSHILNRGPSLMHSH